MRKSIYSKLFGWHAPRTSAAQWWRNAPDRRAERQRATEHSDGAQRAPGCPNILSIVVVLLLSFTACQPSNTPLPTAKVEGLDWPAIEQLARGTTVKLMMWQGDPMINQYMQGFVAEKMRERYGIELQISPWAPTEITKVFLADREAQKTYSSLDVGWLNGENFYQVRKINALYGPFTQLLPNAELIDFENPFIQFDFQQPIDGFECPWGNVQMAMIYDSLRTPQPPQTLAELETYLKANPGKFTIPYEFAGMTLLKAWMIELAGSRDALDGPFDEAKYKRYSGELFAYINRLKPYFWRQGKTFPEGLSAVHQMFANGELDFTLSNNDNEVDNKIIQGVLPKTSKAYVMQTGSIQNSHYLAIPAQAANKAGALVLINFLISPEAQFEKLKPSVWGDGMVLAVSKLPEAWRVKFETMPERKSAPKRADIQPLALREPAPEYMIRLYEDFKTQVIEQ